MPALSPLRASGIIELEEIVEVHAAMVRRIATVYERHPDRVDDLVQEVWIAVWQALPRLNHQAALKSYIARTAQNICVTHVRRALVRQTEPLSNTLPDPAPPPDEARAHAMRLTRLIEAVRMLPENLIGDQRKQRLCATPSRKIRTKLSFGARDVNALMRSLWIRLAF